ncbi:tetratricopeptide repeat protein [Candidatus Poribacteria bacterium]
MNLLQITDLKNGHVQVSWHRGNQIPRHYQRPIPFADPLDEEARKELRWYLEEYLDFPYGAERNRAERLEQRMGEWGESLFNQIFIHEESESNPRIFYHEAVRDGLEQCDLCITSEESTFLNILWELIRDPTPGRGYLAPSLAGLYRQRSGHRIEAERESPAEGQFRVLLVISRPYGKRDVPLGTVSRPMLEALRPLRPRVELAVLRPPTFDALVKRLNERRGFYDLVHFDGHGVFARQSSDGTLSRFGAAEGRGHLVFEDEDGKPHIVNSEELGQALVTCHVPLFVLNACQSMEEGGKDPFSSVASQLVAVGAKGVVAMSYSVYAATAARFMERFYERLADHASLSEAVAAARQRLYTEPHRESVIGALELRDWMVPALYQQEYRYVPISEEMEVAEEDEEAVTQHQRAEEVCPEGRFGFIGRDYDILRIERALWDDSTPWVLLTGIGGAGKTELAFGFARWFAETDGCPDGVFMASFKEKADFGQVIGSIFGYGSDFSRLSDEEQWQRLVGYLRKNHCVLVWDNLELVAGYPEGAMPLATDVERGKFSRLLKALKGGKSRVVITTRKPEESWLGIAYELIELDGLTERDARQMAKTVLRTVGHHPEEFRDDPDYARLIRLLKGHPHSLAVVLPQLRRKSPHEIIEALQHRVNDLREATEDASLAYAFSQMSPRTRRHLPFVGLFVSYVRANMLGFFFSSGDEQRQAYVDIMGEILDTAGWEDVLQEAAGGGLLRPFCDGVYELHPTFPSFLRRQLASEEFSLERLDLGFMRFYGDWAGAFFRGIQKGERSAVLAVFLEEASLLRALRLAEMNKDWVIAERIVRTLGEFYEIRGHIDEWNALRRGVFQSLGQGIPTNADHGYIDLWVYLLYKEGLCGLHTDLDNVEVVSQTILDHVPDNHANERHRGVAYELLSLVAETRQQFEEAKGYHRKLLEIYERLDMKGQAANQYLRLCRTAMELGDFNESEEYYEKALEIYGRLGRDQDAVNGYEQLGTIAKERLELDKAEAHYRKALEICEDLGLERDAAHECLELSGIAEGQGQLDQADELCRKALAIYERLGLEHESVTACYQLGLITETREQYTQAGVWYRKALETYERLGWEAETASGYHQLGSIARKQSQFDQAEQWFQKAVGIFERLGMERESSKGYRQLSIISQRRKDFVQAKEWSRKALKYLELQELETSAASHYKHLGEIAQGQERFDQAEEWYKKELEIRERPGFPFLTIDTLIRLGFVSRQRNRLRKAISWYGRAWSILAKDNLLDSANQVLERLASIMKTTGENEFTIAWRKAFNDEEPPLEFIQKIMEDSEKSEREAKQTRG